MYLKSLELQGFKSFPDKIKLEFGKGITAVVGPNGSGKSNIGDAVRWVLGEQSTKALRGGKMEDVIFSGTLLRKSVGFASVTLNIDNTSRKLSIDNDIVSVTRKLYRSGESEYKINGQSVRLKDIVELFMDTGLGRDGYSIIGQGKIADIVSSKGSERREIFEEAAGISKFRYKKEEANRKLSLAQENILRLRDIISELELRVEPLRIQSEKAKKFIELADTRKQLEISTWIFKLNELKINLNKYEDSFLIRSAEYESKEHEIEQTEINIDNAFSQMQKCSVKIESLRNSILEIERQNAIERSDIAVLENDIVHLNNLIVTYNDQIKQADENSNETKNKIAFHENKLSELRIKENENLCDIAKVSADFESLDSNADISDKSYEKTSLELNHLYIKKSELSIQINTTQANIDETKVLIDKNRFDISEIHTLIDDKYKEKHDLVEALDDVDKHLEEHNNKLGGYEKLYNSKYNALEELKKQYTQKEIRIRELLQKKKVLIDLENNMEGFSRSVKEVIRAKNNGRISGIKGSIAQLIKVDSKYSLAIETALGAALQNIVVDNESTAKRCINLLKELNAGRATFLPMTSIKGFSLTEKNLENNEGYIAIASELVDYDNEYKDIIQNLLGRIVIAEDLELATDISKKYGYKFRIVTLDGQVINAGGSFTGGSSSRSAGVLTRKNEIDRIERQIQELNEDFNNIKVKTDNLKAQVDKLSIEISNEKDNINYVNSDKAKFSSELSLAAQLIEQYEDKLKSLEGNSKHYNDKLLNLEVFIESCNTAYKGCEDDIKNLETQVQIFKQELASLQEKRENMSNVLQDLKLKQLEISKDIAACELVLSQLNELLLDNSVDVNNINSLIESTKISVDEKNKCIQEKNELINSFDDKTNNINELIKQTQKEHQNFEQSANEYRNAGKLLVAQKEDISKELAKVSERKISVQHDYDSIIAEMWEKYQMSKSEASEIAQPVDDIISMNKRLSEVKGKIKALGNVNVAAIDEYKEVNERYMFMTSQLGDVEKSKSELEKLINDLTESMKQMFSESFNTINENFKSIFVELFGGGKAELVLSDPLNVLESGIEINVAPPGKVIKNLSLLSGGEQAFIAIAIYFAILKLRPSPFCILDEIEAALDDVNVSKYAQYLRKFVDTTQFILITHRRGTMEEADVLYGVTMQQKGISKLLKMDNTNAVRNEVLE